MEVMKIRKGDYVSHNGVIGVVIAVGKRLPTGGDTRMRTLEVRVDTTTMSYGRRNPHLVKRLDSIALKGKR